MKLLKDKRVVMTVLSIILVLVVMSSTTYALFFKVHTMENVESYTSGILEITVEEGTALTLNNTLPMTDEEGSVLTPYTFKVTNTGNLAYTFDLKILSTTSNNQINPAYIKVKLDDNSPVILSSLSEGLIANDLTLNPSESITMSVRIWLSINTPNTEIGKNFSAKIVTDGVGSEYVEPDGFNLTVDRFKKLGANIIDGVPDFSGYPSFEGEIRAAEDDLGTSYYFRGAVENNYVKFAGYYWRIIRINGDGTIRIIYDGTSAHSNGEASEDRIIGTSKFNSGSDSNAYVGYMYGTPGSSTYEQIHENVNDSDIKIMNDEWYKNNIEDKGYSKYVADAIYCNDREVVSGPTIDNWVDGDTIYAPKIRIEESFSPSLKCSQNNDKFTVSTSLGNGSLTYPVGLITADEVNMGGGKYQELYKPLHYLTIGILYWTMSSSYSPTSGLYTVAVDGELNDMDASPWYEVGIRPVISLKSDILFTGNGTISSPFEIVE